MERASLLFEDAWRRPVLVSCLPTITTIQRIMLFQVCVHDTHSLTKLTQVTGNDGTVGVARQRHGSMSQHLRRIHMLQPEDSVAQ